MSQQDENDSGKGFKVTDRRLFDERGELRDEAARPEPAPQAPPQIPSPAQPAAEKSEPRQRPDASSPFQPEAGAGEGVDFASFLMSLATSALVALGEIPDPDTGRMYRHLGAARETIEVLGMLQEKTKGNLSADEGRMLQEILYDLRMKYVSLAKAAER